eukprot:6871020-Pyramimonas_sp.AAC.1
MSRSRSSRKSTGGAGWISLPAQVQTRRWLRTSANRTWWSSRSAQFQTCRSARTSTQDTRWITARASLDVALTPNAHQGYQ